jgi:predicted adenylyl cyclase CyaB
MGHNVEIKAFVDNVVEFEKLVASISDTKMEVLTQEDIFFNSSKGRLKLRIFDECSGQLIAYSRDDADCPTSSTYEIFPTDDPSGMRSILELSLGTAGEVIKERHLYMVGRTRIHIDRVECLGTFVELEVVLGENDTVEDGAKVASDLMERLSISESSLIDVAYVDMF